MQNRSRLKTALLATLVLSHFLNLPLGESGLWPTSIAQAEDVLFIGNSFTFGAGSKEAQKLGGVPKAFEAIAKSKGKDLTTQMLAVGGKDLDFHLQQPKTAEALKAKDWDRVVIQGYSLEATHLGDPERFLKSGETFYRRIREAAPRARIVLYQTWARAVGHKLYTGDSTPKTFADPAEMNREIQANYAKLAERLEALEPGTQVELAPVGRAFELCLAKFPELNLHDTDKYHASTAGAYLSASVFYATIFQDDPQGASPEFLGTSLEPPVAAQLQQIASEATNKAPVKT